MSAEVMSEMLKAIDEDIKIALNDPRLKSAYQELNTFFEQRGVAANVYLRMSRMREISFGGYSFELLAKKEILSICASYDDYLQNCRSNQVKILISSCRPHIDEFVLKKKSRFSNAIDTKFLLEHLSFRPGLPVNSYFFRRIKNKMGELSITSSISNSYNIIISDTIFSSGQLQSATEKYHSANIMVSTGLLVNIP